MIARFKHPKRIQCFYCNVYYDEYSDCISHKCDECKKLDYRKLFLDDERDPIDDSWIVFRNVPDLMNFIKKHIPFEMSLDHDLGTDLTGYDFIKQYVDYCLDNFEYSFVKIYVHSQNPVGKKNIEEYWKNYLKSKGLLNVLH